MSQQTNEKADKTSKIKKTVSKPKTKAKSANDKLVIVESPAKAKTISKMLGRGYKVVASNGHIRDLPKSQLGVDVDNDFEPKYITLRGRGEIVSKIKKEAKSASKIFLATDPDREGEAISWHLAQILKLSDDEIHRIVFNEITPNAIKSAIKAPRNIDMQLVDAQQARRLLDRLVGYKISPILWAKVRRGLSAGRVQSVATRIIVDREQEIRDFVPQEYWSIDAILSEPEKHKKFASSFYGKNNKKLEIKNGKQCEDLLSEIGKAQFIVKEIKRGEKKRHPAPPFTTSNLQQEASRKLGFTSKRTMSVAQQLYEGVEITGKGSIGLVTYIRTDSVRVSNDALDQVRTLIETKYGKPYLPAKSNVYKGRKNAQDAHEAIRPSYIDLAPEGIKSSLTLDQFKLYRLIYERFLSSQMTDANYETMSVSILAGEYDFRSNGSRLLFDGYTKVYTEGRDEVKEEKETMLPDMKEGDVLKVEEIKNEQHFTQPPARYTEASLVKTLEEQGIGRPSTYAPTISTIIDRGYVRREKKVLHPTELGEVVTQLMKNNFESIVDVAFTANVEEKLDNVEDGTTDSRAILREFYAPFIKTLEKAEAEIEKIEMVDEESDVVCDKCGRMMVYKVGRFGKFLACPGYPECKNTKPIVESTNTSCPKCGGNVIVRRSKKGRVFYGCDHYPECDFVSWDRPSNKPCPKCNSMMVIKNVKGQNELRCTNKECNYVEIETNNEASENE